AGEHVSFAVEGGDQAVDAVILDDCAEFGAAGRDLADRAVEIDVGDHPAVAAAAHHVIDRDRLAVGLDDLALDPDTPGVGLLAGHFQLLPGIAVEAVGVDRRDVAAKALGHLLTLRLGQIRPGRA